MLRTDSALDARQIARCRMLLATRARKDSVWPPLAAAGLLAVSALAFAAAMITAPSVRTEHVAPARGVE